MVGELNDGLFSKTNIAYMQGKRISAFCKRSPTLKKRAGKDREQAKALPPVTKITFPDKSPISRFGSKDDPKAPKVASLSVGPTLYNRSWGW